MDGVVGAFIGGVLLGFALGVIFFGAMNGAEETACRKEHNFVQCERVYLPAEVEE